MYSGVQKYPKYVHIDITRLRYLTIPYVRVCGRAPLAGSIWAIILGTPFPASVKRKRTHTHTQPKEAYIPRSYLDLWNKLTWISQVKLLRRADPAQSNRGIHLIAVTGRWPPSPAPPSPYPTPTPHSMAKIVISECRSVRTNTRRWGGGVGGWWRMVMVQLKARTFTYSWIVVAWPGHHRTTRTTNWRATDDNYSINSTQWL